MDKKTYYFSKQSNVKCEELFSDNKLFEKFYSLEASGHADMVVIPDGSTDIQCLWKKDQLSIYICGSVTTGKSSRVTDFDRCFGARFRTGLLPEEIKSHLGDIIDNRLPLESIMNIDALTNALDRGMSLEKLAERMTELFPQCQILGENRIVFSVVENIEKCRGHVNISDIIEDTGYSHRYINYVFKNNVGISLKKYAGIIRLQESLQCVLEDQEDTIYDELGYYDQAHFIKDFKNFTAYTPRSLQKNAKEVLFL